jgi:hypothetical protein
MPIMQDTDIAAWLVDTSVSPNTVTPWTLNIEFSIALDSTVLPSTFSLTLDPVLYPTGLPANREIRIARTTEVLQDQTFSQGDAFPEDALETVIDRVVLQNQDQKDKISRSVRAHDSDPDGVDLEIPDADTRAGNYFYWDANGNPTTAATPLGTTSLTPWGSTWINLADTPAALVLLGIDYDIDSGVHAAIPGAPTWDNVLWYSTDQERAYFWSGAAWTELGIQQFADETEETAAGVAGRITLLTNRYEMRYDTGAAYKPIRTFDPGYIFGLQNFSSGGTRVTLTKGACRDRLDEMNLYMSANIFQKDYGGPPWVAGSFGALFVTGSAITADTFYALWLLGDEDGNYDMALTGSRLTLPTAAAEVAAAGFTHCRRVGYITTNAVPNGFETTYYEGWGMRAGQFYQTGEKQIHASAGFNPNGLGTIDLDGGGVPYLVPREVMMQLRIQYLNFGLADQIVMSTSRSQGYLGVPSANSAPGLDVDSTDNILQHLYWIRTDNGTIRQPRDTGLDTNINVNVNLLRWYDDRDDVDEFNL